MPTKKQKSASTIAGGLGGAATGAYIGSFFPGFGTVIGTGVGGLVGLLSGYLGTEPTEDSVLRALNKLPKKQLKDLQSKVKSEEKRFKKMIKDHDKAIKNASPSKKKELQAKKAEAIKSFNQRIKSLQDQRKPIEKKIENPVSKKDFQSGNYEGSENNRPVSDQPGDAVPTNFSDYGPDSSKQSIWSEIWNGSNQGKAANLTPQKTGAQSYILGNALGKLKNEKAYDFGPIEELAQNRFERQIVPGIMERFKGGALNRALASAGKDLNTNLAALRQEHGFEQQKMDRDLFRYGLAQLESGKDQQSAPGLKQNLMNLLSDPVLLQEVLGQVPNFVNRIKENRAKTAADQQQQVQTDNRFANQDQMFAQQAANQQKQRSLLDTGNMLKQPNAGYFGPSGEILPDPTGKMQRAMQKLQI